MKIIGIIGILTAFVIFDIISLMTAFVIGVGLIFIITLFIFFAPNGLVISMGNGNRVINSDSNNKTVAIVNGRGYKGSNISVVDDKVFIDGVEQNNNKHKGERK